MLKSIIIFFILLSFSKSSFSSDSPVFTLNSANFDKNVIMTKDNWLILFYNPLNEDFKKLKPEFEKAALAMNGIFKLGAIDIHTEKNFKNRYNLTSPLTMKFFGINKTTPPQDFISTKTAPGIIEKMFKKVQSVAFGQINIIDDDAQLYTIEHDPNIIVLDDENFDDTIQKNELMTLVAFHSPRCGICRRFLPNWAKAAARLKGKAVFCIIDGTINRQTSDRFSLRRYPLIKIYSPGYGRMKKLEDYLGPRDEDGIVEYVLKKSESYMYISEPPQITNQDIIENECRNKEGYCIITLFPNIKKSSAKERNKYISIIHNATKTYKTKSLHFLWAQENDFPKLEKNFQNHKYPVTIAVDFKKRLISYNKYEGDFDNNSLEVYLKTLLEGKANLVEYVGGLEIDAKTKWNRKDYVENDINEEL